MIQLDLIRTCLKKLRIDRNITPEYMASALSIDVSNYNRIENGKRKTFDIDLLDIICNTLGVSMIDVVKQGYFVREKDSKELFEELSKLITQCAEEKERLILFQRQYIDKLLALDTREGTDY